MGDVAFSRAVAFIASSSVPSSSSTKLHLYALYKIATLTLIPSVPRPSLFDFTQRAKWDSWHALGSSDSYRLSAEEVKEKAKEEYRAVAVEMGWTEEDDEEEVPEAAGSGVQRRGSTRRAGRGGSGMVSVSKMEDELPPGGLNPSRLHDLAVENRTVELQEFLSWDGAVSKIDERDSYGFTALHLAADRGNIEIVHLLIDAGADPSLQDSDGNTAQQLAEEAGHDQIVSILSALP